MNPAHLPIARELFIQWRRARGDRGEAATRNYTRGWEELLEDAGILSATERNDAERDVRALAADGWIKLIPVRYKPHLLYRIILPLVQEARWKEAFGFVAPTDEEERRIREHPWQPELAFLREARVNLGFAELQQIDAFLKSDGRDCIVVPIKERSLEIFGDEKRLDLVADSTLFRAGRLTLDHLRCETVAEPLGWRRGPASVAPDAPVLVVENCATWHSFVRWNESAARYRAVVYGRGNAFIDSVSLLPDLFTELGGAGPILYFGDLDPAGLRIPRRAHERAIRLGLPAIQPATWCYEALLTCAAAAESAEEGSGVDETDLEWLGGFGEKVRALFRSNRRLAQEHIGREFLLKLPS